MIGLNCALGAEDLRPYVAELARIADTGVSLHPNAGLPNEFGEYDDTPGAHGARARRIRDLGLSQHGRRLLRHHARAHSRNPRARCSTARPRKLPKPVPALRLAGLEPLNIGPESLFVNIGERTNVTGSAQFRTLIAADDYAGALVVARQQVENGAQVIDVNMDEGMLDSVAAMERFLKLVAGEPDIARVPVMVDSSRWEVIEAGLKCVQGKGDRQFDQPEGGRGVVSAPGTGGPPPRRRRRW